jgi:Leucine-rich repeat (LRR) protein
MNITANNLTQFDFLKDLSPENTLEFLNISQNMFTDVTPVLKRCGKLKELHCQANVISSIRECKVASQELKIIDLSGNKLQEEKDLAGLVGVSSLIIINILSNPLTQGTWKHNWTGTISLNNIYTMDNLYVLLSLPRLCLPMATRRTSLSA